MRPYRIFHMSSGADERRLEAHVFVRAYRGAWRAIHGAEPAGRHELPALELAIDFGELAPLHACSSDTEAAPPGERYDH